jgi:Domain of unknown function (DUF4437)
VRPHVELIHEDDYIWHDAEMPTSEGKARQRNLSVDEEDGSCSLRVDFVDDWGRPGGYHHADAEYFVIEGELEVGGKVLGQGGYLQAPKGVAIPYLRAKAGTKVLHYREYGDAGFDESAIDRSSGYGEATILDTAAMDWLAVMKEGPAPGLFIKMLHQDPRTGFYSRLIWAKPGWTDHRLAHHPCYEEAYTLAGSMVYNFGDLDPGTYFFRPARVKHGHFISHEPDGAVWLIRSDGELVNWYTTNESVHVHGDAENYDTETEGPVLASMPVRSRTAGPWDGDGM